MKRAAILLAAVTVAVAVGGGAAFAKTIRCDGGNCFGTNRSDSIYGTNRHDAIFAKDGGDFVTGREGADNLNGDDGNDRVLGGRADDWVKGGRHRDTVKGNRGNDTLNGGSGHNTIRAGDGMKDFIVCGAGSENLIFFDPGLDHFSNCDFHDSREAEILESSARDKPAVVSITASGPPVSEPAEEASSPR